MSRYRDPQLQVTESLCYLQNLSPNIYQCIKIESIFYFKQLVIQVVVKHRMSTVVDIGVLGVKTQNVYCSRHQCSRG